MEHIALMKANLYLIFQTDPKHMIVLLLIANFPLVRACVYSQQIEYSGNTGVLV